MPAASLSALGIDPHSLKGDPAAPEWEALRRLAFPAEAVNLNPGTLGTPSALALAAQAAHVSEAGRASPLGQYQAGREALAAARRQAQRLFGPHEVAITAGTTALSNLLMLALLANHPDGPLDVLSSHHEHYGGLAGFERHPRARVRYLEDAALEDPEAVAVAAVGVDLVFLSHVTWTEGRTLPIAAISRALGALSPRPLFIVDAAQSLGLVPPPVGAADGVLGSGHKWLFLPPGSGLLWAGERLKARAGGISWAGEPLDAAAPTARWEAAGGHDFSLYAGMAAGLGLLADLGQEAVAARSELLAEGLYADLSRRLSALGIAHRRLPQGAPRAPGGVCVDLLEIDPYPAYVALGAQGIHLKCVKRRLGSGRLLNALRLGVPFYETPQRLARAAEAIAGALAGAPRAELR